MIRTQVSLGEDEMERLRAMAAERRVSIASLLRESVDLLLEDAASTNRRRRALAAAGRFRWQGSGRDHDEELMDAFDS